MEVQVDREEEEVEVAVEHHQGQEEAVMVEGEVDTEEVAGVDMEEEVGADMGEEVEVVEAASQVEIEEVHMEAEAEGSVEETEIEPLVLDQVGVEEVQVLAEALEEMGREMVFTADQLQEGAQRHPLILATVMSHQEGEVHRGGRLMTITMTTRRTEMSCLSPPLAQHLSTWANLKFQ